MKNMQILRAKLLAFGVVALSLAGCRRTPQPPPDHPRLASGVSMQDVKFFSQGLQREMTYRVFLPTKLAPGQKFPVVYLLHGLGDGFTTWSNNSDVARYAADDLILVMPEGESSYFMNSVIKPGDKYEDYLAYDLISDVETRFPAATGRENRAIIGISMGGFAAVKLALTHPELFVYVGALSPAIDAPSRHFSFSRADQWFRFARIFGPPGSKTRRSSDPFILEQSASPALTPYLYITAGEREALLGPIRRFASGLHAHHFSYEFHTKPGGHDWAEWDAQVPGCFESMLQHLKPVP